MPIGAGVFFDPDKVESPRSKEEIIQVVNHAIENRQKLRVLGSGHSRSKIALSDDIILSLHRYTGVTNLDKKNMQVSWNFVRNSTHVRASELNWLIYTHHSHSSEAANREGGLGISFQQTVT